MFTNVGEEIKKKAERMLTKVRFITILLMLPFAFGGMMLCFRFSSIGAFSMTFDSNVVLSIIIFMVTAAIVISFIVLLSRMVYAILSISAKELYAFGDMVEKVRELTMEMIRENGPEGYILNIGYYRIEGNVIKFY